MAKCCLRDGKRFIETNATGPKMLHTSLLHHKASVPGTYSYLFVTLSVSQSLDRCKLHLIRPELLQPLREKDVRGGCHFCSESSIGFKSVQILAERKHLQKAKRTELQSNDKGQKRRCGLSAIDLCFSALPNSGEFTSSQQVLFEFAEFEHVCCSNDVNPKGLISKFTL